MFDKKNLLWSVKDQKKNDFTSEAMKQTHQTYSGNNALKYDTSGNDFVDQFTKIGAYRQLRSYNEISSDMQLLWSQDKLMTLKFVGYLRLITRKVQYMDGSTTEDIQKGAGLKHESIMRMLWVAVNYPQDFYNNIVTFISCGSWKDIFTMLEMDLVGNNPTNLQLDWDMFMGIILAGLNNGTQRNLILKYLPQWKSRNKATTPRSQARVVIAKKIANIMGISQVGYRQLKSSGNAHKWQQLISKQLFNKIDFNTIHGRALMLLTDGKFLENQNLESKYEEWIKSQPVAKFTGFPYELLAKIDNGVNKIQTYTIEKQFETLIKLAKENTNVNSKLIVVRDTSGSMTSSVRGLKNYTSDQIAKSLALFFGEMLEGKFKNHWIEFNSNVQTHEFKGKTIIDKWVNDRSRAYGSTNFQSVIDLFVTLKQSGVDEKEFPTGILCISDYEFNPADINATNVATMKTKLSRVFSKSYVENFKLILWNIPNNFYNKDTTFETYGNEKNVFYFGGFDGSVLGFLLGKKNEIHKKTPQNAEELFKEAMSQEILNTFH